MSVTVLVPAALRQHAGGRGEVVLAGCPATVADALAALFDKHPGLRDRVLTQTGELRQHVHLFVGSESIRDSGGFATPLPEGAELTILPAVSGGR
jgi:molybdopterin converting factor small subunit